MQLSENIQLSAIDSDNEVMGTIIFESGEEGYIYISKDMAIDLVKHLQEQFGI